MRAVADFDDSAISAALERASQGIEREFGSGWPRAGAGVAFHAACIKDRLDVGGESNASLGGSGRQRRRAGGSIIRTGNGQAESSGYKESEVKFDGFH